MRISGNVWLIGILRILLRKNRRDYDDYKCVSYEMHLTIFLSIGDFYGIIERHFDIICLIFLYESIDYSTTFPNTIFLQCNGVSWESEMCIVEYYEKK